MNYLVKRKQRISLETNSEVYLLGLNRKDTTSKQNMQETAKSVVKAFDLIGGLGAK
jgi:hypothetical protein